MKIKLKKLHKDAVIPTYATDGSAAVDLYAIEDVSWRNMETKCIRSGWVMEIPKGWYAEIRPRSGISIKNSLIIPNSPCTIDSDYRGEVVTYMKLIFTLNFNIRKGDRYAQMMIKKVIPIEFEEAEELSKTDRGTGGFGSTGV
jgi:dUTP pyrophosphatase